MAASEASFPQNSEDSIKNVIQTLFLSMKNADTTSFKTTFADNSILQTVDTDKNGNVNVQNTQLKNFVDFIGKEEKGSADERIIFETIKIDGPLASVWAPYKFYYKGKFSHCGVDVFQLVNFAEGWKIQYLIDTRRKDECK
jgi:hypothetical protein